MEKYKRIIAFGDSFIVDRIDGNWVTKLSKSINLPQYNYAALGSALNFSLNKFMDYAMPLANYPQHLVNDIIIFGLTLPNRICAKGQDPGVGVAMVFIENGLFPNRTWVHDNKEHIKWVTENIYHESINLEIDKTVGILKVFADAHPNSLVIIVDPFHGLKYRSKLYHLFSPTQNFLPLVGKGQQPSLMDVSNNERMNEVTRYIYDPRANHLSQCNLDLLASMVEEVIRTKSVLPYDSDRFLSNCFNNPTS